MPQLTLSLNTNNLKELIFQKGSTCAYYCNIRDIFSCIPLNDIRNTWILIDESCPNFAQTGLMRALLIKAENIAVMYNSTLTKKLGALSKRLMS